MLHSGHDLEKADDLYKRNVDDIHDLANAIDDKVKRQREVKANIETMDQKIIQSYQQVGIIYHTVINVFMTNTSYLACAITLYVTNTCKMSTQ